MEDHLNFVFQSDDEDLVSAYDDLPLWSAAFGLKLLEVVDLKPALRVLDLGCGTGFPLIELSQRMGRKSVLWGLDPWMRALERARMKGKVLGLKNVQVICGNAERMPFRNGAFDLIVANNGINNVKNPMQAINECWRVCAPGGQLAMTMNLRGTMKEFYEVFKQVLGDLGVEGGTERIEEHIDQKRMPLENMVKLLEEAGFSVNAVNEDSFCINFSDGTAMLRYHFIKCFFLEAWKSLVAKERMVEIFRVVEDNLNKQAAKWGGLYLTVPHACLNCRKRA